MQVALLSLYDLENNAVRLLSAILRKAGHQVCEIYFKDWKNNAFSPPTQAELENLVRLLKEKQVKLLGISLRASPYFQVACQLTALIQERLAIPVLWGGTHPILCPEECIKIADLVCLGEGEQSLPRLLALMEEQKDYTGLLNFWFRKGAQVIKNPLANLIEELDSLPFRDYLSPDKYVIQGRTVRQLEPVLKDPVYQMLCSRGCPFNCSFCYNSVFKSEIYSGKGKYYRLRSVKSVIAELKEAKAVFPHLKRIKFDDEVFPFEEAWLAEFCRLYPREIGLPFEIFTEPKLVREECFKALKEAGLKVVYMGVQNNFRICKELYDRNTPEPEILKAVKLFKQLKLDARYQVIVDDPVSEESDRRELFSLLLEFPRPFALYLFSLTVYPRTAIAKKLLELKKITPDQIEGKATKTFKQLRVDLAYPRSKEGQFQVSLLVLLSKDLLPKKFLKWLAGNKFLKAHPCFLSGFAQGCNFLHMGYIAGKMLFKGELTGSSIKRWLNFRSLITQ